MTSLPRLPSIYHCTSEPYRFFGREAELALLDRALAGDEPSVVALVGPGGQGKTAIVQHWLERLSQQPRSPDGVFLWSFYRGKDSDLCLGALFAYAEGLPAPPEVSASYCVDHLLPILQRERWALIFDGAEVVQHESGPWFGRFLHPELGRLIEELASAPLPGVVVVTSRFPLPSLASRHHALVLALSTLDSAGACGLLASLGVRGSAAELEEAAASCGLHAKAVELLGTYLSRFQKGEARAHRRLPDAPSMPGASAEEVHVARVLCAHQEALPAETRDILGLSTAFRSPPTEARLLEYLGSDPLRNVLHQTWGRRYAPFADRPDGWLAAQVEGLVQLRLLERVGLHVSPVANAPGSARPLIDAHPLVRRGFEEFLGPSGQEYSAQARAGFLRGRPDRRPPESLEEAREEVELFHAYCDAGLWNEADGIYVALDNPKHRFLAPAFERDLLLRFFPEGDWHRPPLWSGFGRQRSLAICFELLGQFEDALYAYRSADAALRGDALIALGRLQPLLDQEHAASPWQTLWQAYRAHALCLAGRMPEAVVLARSLVPVDVYEWVHVFECLLRAGELASVDLGSLLYRPPLANEHRWSVLARKRMRADYLRVTSPSPPVELGQQYQELIDAYDRGGLPYERTLARLSYGRWLAASGDSAASERIVQEAIAIAERCKMSVAACVSRL